MDTIKITYPYLPEGRTFIYVPIDNPFMKKAEEYAMSHSLDKNMPNSSIIVKDSKIIGCGANGSDYHIHHTCQRVRLNIPTGQGYELCEGCHPKNHGESKALADAKKNGFETQDADVYMWGHWWCCKPCWDAMIGGGIKDVYLLDRSVELFKK
jgi:deoxycytidylate deaminase